MHCKLCGEQIGPHIIQNSSCPAVHCVPWEVGTKVECNGYAGIIKEVCQGVMLGMYVVDMYRDNGSLSGPVCVGSSAIAHVGSQIRGSIYQRRLYENSKSGNLI